MANQITDARTLLFDGGDGTGGAPDDLLGAATGTTDTSTFIEGSTSYTYSQSNSIDGMLFDAGTAQDYSSNTFWLWVNSGVVGLMLAKASGGFTVRFCGATVTDFFEVYVGGNDDWPSTFEGGWAMFVVDIEEASANPSNTGGTAPATSAIRYVGMTCNLTIMPKMADNTWLDAIWRNPTVDPAWIVEGRDGGSTDWDMSDIAAQLGIGAGLVIPTSAGSFTLFGPGQFGINDSTTHGFTSTNDILLWANEEFVLDGFYKLSALGNSGGTTDVTFGSKTGTGDDATGAQGAVIAAAGVGTRWAMDFNDPDLDGINFYGCSFLHGEDFLLDDVAVSVISTLYIDCDSALISNSEQLRVSVIAANTADGVAFMTTDDLGDIVFGNFAFSDGHGVELTTPRIATQTSKGNVFTGYGSTGTNDAAIFNDTAGDVVISVTENGTIATFRNGTSATTTISATATYTINNVANPSEVTILDRDVVMLDITGSATTLKFGDAAATEKMGQSFQVAATAKVERVRIRLRKVGTPTDGVRIRIVDGVPGSTELLVSTFLDAADITTSFVEYDIDLDGKTSLTLTTTYGFEIERSGAVNGTDHYEIEFDSGNPESSGVRYIFNVTWGASTGDLLLTIMEAASDNELYHEESVTTGTTVWNHDGTAREIEVLLMSTLELPVFYLDTVTSADKSNAVVQSPDRVYSNP